VLAHTCCSTPAVTVKLLLVMVTASVKLHVPLVTVQSNMLAPVDKPVTVVTKLVEFENVPVPPFTLQTPVPTDGFDAVNSALVAQTV